MKVLPAHSWDVSPEVTCSVGRTDVDCVHQHRVALSNKQIEEEVIFQSGNTNQEPPVRRIRERWKETGSAEEKEETVAVKREKRKEGTSQDKS